MAQAHLAMMSLDVRAAPSYAAKDGCCG